MKKEDLQKLTVEQLRAKEKSSKTLFIIFIPLVLGLFYFALRDFVSDGGEINIATFTIAICSLGGMASLFPDIKAIQQELKVREATDE